MYKYVSTDATYMYMYVPPLMLSCCLESEEQWSLVQAFCGCHSLPLSTAFLSVCAQEAQWLPLLCHAQLYAIPPQKVQCTYNVHLYMYMHGHA